MIEISLPCPDLLPGEEEAALSALSALAHQKNLEFRRDVCGMDAIKIMAVLLRAVGRMEKNDEVKSALLAATLWISGTEAHAPRN